MMESIQSLTSQYGVELRWIGIFFCLSQSAVFSGLNLAVFSLSRLQLEVEAGNHNRAAILALGFRKDSNFLLSTILWGNVGINVLLTLISGSVMTGGAAFLFSTVVITLCGEIIPQAYFSRNALKMTALLAPVLRFYQILLYPVARSSAWLLDRWLGREAVEYMRERDLRAVLQKHVESDEADVEHLEGVGALNFLEIDNQSISQEGELVDPDSIIVLPVQLDLPIFPEFERVASDPFVTSIERSGHKWVVLTNESEVPLLVLDADGFLRAAFFGDPDFNPYMFCHRPLVVTNPEVPLGDVIWQLKKDSKTSSDEVIDKDLILFWGETRRIITGADILGRLLKGTISPKSAGPELGYLQSE